VAGHPRPIRPNDQLARLAGLAAATGQEARLAAARRRMQTIRLTDAERDTCAEQLSDQFVLGRLDRDELEDRLELLNRARVHGELPGVFEGLPMPRLYGPAQRRPSRWPWVLAAAVASLALPFLTIGMVLVLLGREIAAAFFVGPALLWMLLAARWASRRTKKS
jgi:Flp pilus assembly protein TadB